MVMVNPEARGLNFFGIALDPTDDELKLRFKTIMSRRLGSSWRTTPVAEAQQRPAEILRGAVAAGGLHFDNPYAALTSCLEDLIDEGLCRRTGEVEVPSWLAPAPEASALGMVTAEHNLDFIEKDGCREYARRAADFAGEKASGDIPAMIAVDHSMTGGLLGHLAEAYGSSNLTVLVVDSHFDAIPLCDRMELFRYAQAQHPGLTLREDAARVARAGAAKVAIRESYDCATWLGHLLAEGIVLPDRLIVFGVSDYPTDAIRHDDRLGAYVESYLRHERNGVRFVTREQIRKAGVAQSLAPLLHDMATDYLYISLDADIGSLSAVHAARFMNVVGIGSDELYQVSHLLREAVMRTELIGLDINGIETFLLGRSFPNGVQDRTLEVLSDFIRILLGRASLFEGAGLASGGA